MARDRNVKKWLSKLIISHCGLRFSAYDYLFKMHPESGKEREAERERAIITPHHTQNHKNRISPTIPLFFRHLHHKNVT